MFHAIEALIETIEHMFYPVETDIADEICN
jgi:hypothetical protein